VYKIIRNHTILIERKNNNRFIRMDHKKTSVFIAHMNFSFTIVPLDRDLLAFKIKEDGIRFDVLVI
jgi:hypothetical protein